MKYRIFYFWDARNPGQKKRSSATQSTIAWAHKTKMFLLSSHYVVIIILIMMIQGQGQALFLGPGLGLWPLALALYYHDQDDDDYVVNT